MQRKNSFLRPKHRSAMAMIMAIAVIVIMATIMALSLSLSSQTTKESTTLYLYEESALLAKGATEYALLKIAQDGACSHTNDLNFKQDGIYDINISLKYIYLAPSPCTADETYATVTTDEQNGSVLMDISVSVDQNVSGTPIRYFKRTMQKL
jgi:type II secretory pathway pseudopilin PulG